jgi:hypothetical protein
MTSQIVTIRFSSKGHIGSEIAALLAQSKEFSHCMLIDEGMVYEAVTWKGVQYVPLKVSMKGIVRYQDMDVLVPDIEAMRAFLRDKLGAGYDWLGAVGLPVLRSGAWQDPERWWCSELILAALGAGGIWLVDPKQLEWGTPNDVFQYDLPKSKIVYL